jgi:hypothetical protein
LTRELLDTLQMMVLHFTKTPLTLADSKARGKAHEVIAKAYEQIGYATPAQSTRDACQIDNFSTRVCKYGTRSCISEHTAPTAALEKGDGRDAIRNAVDLLNNLAERQELAGFPLTAASTRHTAKELAAALSQKAGEQHA